MKSFSKNNLRAFLLMLIVTGIAVSCSGGRETHEDETAIPKTDTMHSFNDHVILHKVDCWINLMPNSGGKVFLRGEIELCNLEDPSSYSLSYIKLIQLDAEKYRFNPQLSGDYLKRNSRVINFTESDGGMDIKDILDPEKEIDAVLVFNKNHEKYYYTITGIKMEKVY